MYYDLTTLTGPILDLRALNEDATGWVQQAGVGTFLGSWNTDIGVLARLMLLRGYETHADLLDERQRTLKSRNPFNGGDRLQALQMESFEGFPFLDNASPRSFGGVYEFRTYILKPGGLPATLEAWKSAIEPAKDYTDHLVINLFALDGPPRITHIWGFESLGQRADLRGRYYKAGLWPPKGGPEQILEATSTIA